MILGSVTELVNPLDYFTILTLLTFVQMAEWRRVNAVRSASRRCGWYVPVRLGRSLPASSSRRQRSPVLQCCQALRTATTLITKSTSKRQAGMGQTLAAH